MFSFYNFFIYIVLSAVTPGPNNILSMSNTAAYGFKKTFPFNMGVFVGCMVVVPICAIFTAALFEFIPKVRIYMQIFGAGYMLYLAWVIWRSSASDIKLKENKGAGFVAGVFMQFINPKLYVYAITTMSVYVLPYFKDVLTVTLLITLFAFVGFLGTVLWSFFGLALCRVFAKYTKVVNGVMSLLMVYCAVSLFI